MASLRLAQNNRHILRMNHEACHPSGRLATNQSQHRNPMNHHHTRISHHTQEVNSLCLAI